MDKEKLQTYKVTMELPLDFNGHLIGQLELVSGENNVDHKRYIGQSIMKSFHSYGKIEITKLFSKAKELFENNYNKEAIDVLLSPEFKTTILFIREIDENDIEFLKDISIDALNNIDEDKKEEFIKFRVAFLATYTDNKGYYSLLREDIDWLLKLKEISPDFEFTLKLQLANMLAKEENWNTAELAYFELVNNNLDSISQENIAWLFNNMSVMYLNKQDGNEDECIKYLLKSADIWMEVGNYKKACKSYMGIVNRIKNNDFGKALKFLNQIIEHIKKRKKSLGDNVVLGYLYQEKADFYFKTNDFENAIIILKKCYDIRKNIIGQEEEIKATINYLILINQMMKNEKEVKKWSDLLIKLPKKDNENLKDKVIELTKGNNISDEGLEKLEDEILREKDATIIITFYMAAALAKIENNISKSMLYIDKGLRICNKSDNESKAGFYQLSAMIYEKMKNEEKEYEFLNKSFKLNPYNVSIFPRLIHLSQKFKKYNIIFECANKWKVIDSKNPIPWFLIGEYYKNTLGNNYLLAKENYEQAKSLVDNEKDKKIIQEKIDKIINMALNNTGNRIDKIEEYEKRNNISNYISFEERFMEILNEFKKVTEESNTNRFWRTENGKKKWVSKPENFAQGLLIQHLKTCYTNDVEVLEEVPIDTDRMDIYIRVTNGIKIVIELKMCGNGYSTTYTSNAQEQIQRYMKKKEVKFGVIIVLDGRANNEVPVIDNEITFEGNIIRCINIRV